MFKYAKQFASADVILISAPYWDLSFPAILKTYFENINVNGITFSYSEKGYPVSLCKAKKLIYITTSGGPIISDDFGFGYIKSLAKNFYGIADIAYIKAEGLDIFGANIQEILEKAKKDIDKNFYYRGFYMKKIIFTLLALILFNSYANAETFRFAQVTDVHYPKTGITGYEDRNFDFAIKNYNKAIDMINKSDVEYVFFTGDIVDKSFKEVFDDFFNATSKLNKKYYISQGNHDSNSTNGFTKEDTLEYLKNNTPYQQKSANYYVVLNENFIAVMLDGSKDFEMDAQGFYSKQTIKWLEKILKENPNKQFLIFQHFPLLEPVKDSAYVNKHSTRKKGNYIKLLKKYKNIVLIASGHYHVSWEKEKHGVKHYSTSALFLEDSYYRVFEIDFDNGKINYIKTNLIQVK